MSPKSHDTQGPEERNSTLSSLSVLHVDDEQVFRDVCEIYLEKYGIHVTPAGSVREALHLIESCRFDVILSDYEMPDIDGAGFLRILRERKITVPVILLSGMNPARLVVEAISNGAVSCVQKGGNPRMMFEDLARRIRNVSQQVRVNEFPSENGLRYRTLFEHAGTAIITLDYNLLIATANTGFSNLTGYSKDEIEGVLRWHAIARESDAGQMMDHICLLRKGLTPPEKELTFFLKTKNNQERPVLATVSPVADTRWSVASLIEIWQSPVLRDSLRTKNLNLLGDSKNCAF